MQEGAPIIIKKKKVHGHGHHGGAWKVAYADFVTAMMAFFMVMWILGMSDDQKEAIAAYFNDPTGFSKRTPTYPVSVGIMGQPLSMIVGSSAGASNGVMKDQAQMKEVREQVEDAIAEDPLLQDLAKKGDLVISQTGEGLLIELIENETNGEVFFEVGSSIVRAQARAVFKKITPMIAKSGRILMIRGHTDARAFPGANYNNFNLSADRATAVMHLLLANGINMKNIVEVAGRADRDLRKPDDPYHFSNRRVTILLPFKYAQEKTHKLPAEIVDDQIEGVFVKPKDPRVDPMSTALGKGKSGH
ncbi:flagellar motor protein MotB [Kamptonema cortianum]|nr:flagellar motor protein MotB [Geitlerinema splendidum]MDK3161146.1 flagellar motor protein MotB [Kamptonema cortianum]